MTQAETHLVRNSTGFTLIEILVSVSLISILAAGLSQTMITVTDLTMRSAYRSEAMQLANDRLESLALVDPSTLDVDDSLTEQLRVGAHRFVRTTSVSVRPSGVRRCAVTVQPQQARLNFKIELSNSFALWGSQ